MQFRIFKNKNIIQGISDSSFGSMTGKKGEKRAVRFLKSLGYENIDQKRIVWAEQVFGSKVHICKFGDSGKVIKSVDGLLSNIPAQTLGVISGDCLPILLYDPKNKVVGVFHGARVSLIKGIIKKGIEKMVFNFGSDPKNILVGIGPHIRKCHYWFEEKTYQNFKNTKFKKYSILKNKKRYFDLTKFALDELLNLGIKRKNIEDCKICTFCQFRKYFSARKKEDGFKIYSERNPRFAGFIGLKTSLILKFPSRKFNLLRQKLVESIKKGKILILPTDTVYGLIADATNKKAVERLFKIKKRPENKPVPIFIKDISAAKKLAEINKKQEAFLKSVWPGKITIVLKRKKSRLYGVDKKTIALRIPKYGLLLSLAKQLNRPLTGTSANISGRPASTKIKEVIKQFKNQKQKPDLVIDAGNLKPAKPSKVIDFTGSKPKILRK